jgi:hypothetical protein
MSQVIAVQGPLGTRKSSMLLSWRREELDSAGKWTFVFDLERGIHRAQPFFPNCNIETWVPETLTDEGMKASLMFTRGDVLVGKMELWDEITTKYVEVLNDPKYAVVGFDTGKVLWEIDHQSYLQEIQLAGLKDKPNSSPRKTLQPIEYSNPNGRFTSVIGLARATQTDLFLVNHERPKYISAIVNGEVKEIPSPTEVELDGFSKTGNFADWMFQTRGGGEDVSASILKSPIGSRFVGLPFKPPTFNSFWSIIQAGGALSLEMPSDGVIRNETVEEIA